MNFKKRKYIFILAVIIFIAAILRFWQLGSNPPSLTWDEAAWGYNAYSLGIDGRDEFGRFLPLDYLESFGDFKPPLYGYIDILPVKLFGLSEFAVRFPSAFFGVLTVLFTYFLTKRIFFSQYSPPRNRFGTHRLVQPFATPRGWATGLPRGETVALLSTFLLAISPWHINLSRAAFEANVATFFIVCGVWLFLAAVQSKKWLLLLSVSSFVLSIYTFNTARIVSPILFVLLSLTFWKGLWKIKYQVIIAVVAGILLILPIAKFLVSPQASLRFKEVNIFSDIEVIERTNQEIENDKNVMWSRILHNRRFAYAVEYIKHYLDNLSPSFLFLKGDGNPKFSTQDVGQIYLIELPFLIAGILFLFRKREGNWWIVPFWLLMGIVPAATARETPHALRIETTLPTWQILVAYGVINIVSLISNLKLQIANTHFKFKILNVNLLFTIYYLLLAVNFLYYLHGYYVHYPREFSGEWQYGYKEAISYIKSVENKYDRIYFTEGLGRPYIYFLFYTQYDPKKFRQEAIVEREAFGFVHVYGFEKYRFVKDIKSTIKSSEEILYIDTPSNIPGSANIVKRFFLLNGDKTLVAYTL